MSSAKSLDVMFQTPIPRDYKRHCFQVKASIVVFISLLAIEIILFRTVGDLKSIIIGFGCAKGVVLIIGLVSQYYVYGHDKKTDDRRKTVTSVNDLINSLMDSRHTVDSQGKLPLITELTDTDSLIEAIVACNEKFKDVKGTLSLKRRDICFSIKEHPIWKQHNGTELWKNLKQDSRLKDCQDFIKEIEAAQGPITL